MVATQYPPCPSTVLYLVLYYTHSYTVPAPSPSPVLVGYLPTLYLVVSHTVLYSTLVLHTIGYRTVTCTHHLPWLCTHHVLAYPVSHRRWDLNIPYACHVAQVAATLHSGIACIMHLPC